MPLVLRPRDYDETFYQEMALPAGPVPAGAPVETEQDRLQREIDELFPPN